MARPYRRWVSIMGAGLLATGGVLAGGAALAAGNGAVLTTGTAVVNGKSETVLTTPQGYTLYYFTPDTATHAACTGACAKIWPPLLSPSATPQAAVSLPGTLRAVADSNGNQVQYNGHFLYRFVKDTKPGQATGEGFLGKWYVATPDLAAAPGYRAQPVVGSATATVPHATRPVTGIPLEAAAVTGGVLMLAGGALLRRRTASGARG